MKGWYDFEWTTDTQWHTISNDGRRDSSFYAFMTDTTDWLTQNSWAKIKQKTLFLRNNKIHSWMTERHMSNFLPQEPNPTQANTASKIPKHPYP